MGEFVTSLLSRVPLGIDVPDPLRMLFEWVDDNGFVRRRDDGELFGYLSAQGLRGPGTNLMLYGCTSDGVENCVTAWFGLKLHDFPDGPPRLWPFCRTGSDGSQAALWADPDGRTRIVHLGSGSGSLLTCVLGDDAVDFLRLVAIGYDEICWNEDWHQPPQPEPDRQVANEPYRRWVTSTFSTTIPATALEIVPFPSEMGDADTDDVWCRWVNALS
ncbi:MAG: hypothetical protein FWH11_09660 [Micrococcales bacterium]|nr:hypothetical protein [Micrococcales bacterium]